MREIRLPDPADFAAFRHAARELLAAGVEPRDIAWRVGEDAGDGLFGEGEPIAPESAVTRTGWTVPRRFLAEAESAFLHSDPARHALLYRLLWRLRDEPKLLDLASDPDVISLGRLAKSVRRDIHKMHAFVRFRLVNGADGPETYVAWYEPDHHIVEAATPFFARRFANMDWAILTPRRSAFWTGSALRFGPGAECSAAPSGDSLEDLWRSYYSSTFNPARVNPRAMKAELPVRFWKNLPEAQLIRPLIAAAPARTQEMIAAEARDRAVRPVAQVPLPREAEGGLDGLRREASACRACPLWEPATQIVFGEGPETAKIMLIGEQPGDEEDISGRPFVGPAGRLLDRAIAEAGLDREGLYVTNAVKHFKFEPRGKRRIHKTPEVREIRACAGWLQREIELVAPELIVLLGASAARAVLGKAVPVKASRGRLLAMEDGRRAILTAHPAYVLRVPDRPGQERAYRDLVEDLRLAARIAEGTGASSGEGLFSSAAGDVAGGHRDRAAGGHRGVPVGRRAG